MEDDSVTDGLLKYYRSVAVRTLADFDCWLSVQDLCVLAARGGHLDKDRDDAEKINAFLSLAVYRETVTANTLGESRFLKLKAGGSLVGLSSWEDEDPNRPNTYQEYLERRAENAFNAGSRERPKFLPLSADRGPAPLKLLDRSKLKFGLKSVQDKVGSESQPKSGRALSPETPPLTEAGSALAFMNFGRSTEAPSTSEKAAWSLPWTEEEEQKIIKGKKKGLSPTEMAYTLPRRTEEAVRVRRPQASNKKKVGKARRGGVAKLKEKKM